MSSGAGGDAGDEREQPKATRKAWSGLMLSVLAALCSAIYLFPYKRASALAPADVLAYALLIIAALSSSALDVWQRRRERLRLGAPKPMDPSTFWKISITLAMLAITGNFCGAQAVTRLEPAIASVLLRTEIVFVGVLGAFLLGEGVTPALSIGALIAIGGLVVMRWPLAFDAAGAGAFWALGAAASFGLMQVVTRRVIARIAPVRVNTARLWIAIGLWSLWPGLLRSAVSRGLEFWSYVAVAGLFGPFLGRLLIMYSLRTLQAARSALLLLLAPVFAFSIGLIFFGSVPTERELLGGVIMLAGIALPSLSQRARAGGA